MGTIVCDPRTPKSMRIRFSSRRNQVVGRFKKFLAGFSHQNAHSLAGIFGALKGILLALKGIP